ncbi:MAG: PolC-type DNA polymerase III [Allobaculum sp.]|uniref:3'-5' exonuclease n=1 Tax=Allobaculum sp. TaxID=1872463 RepID=UPI00399A33A5
MDLQGFGATKEYVRLTNRHFEQVHRFYIALDLETTGLSPDSDRIVEIGAVAFRNGQPAERFYTFVNPGRPIPIGASMVNHITDDMVADAPDEREALLELFAFLNRFSGYDLLFVGHNAAFDFSFLCAACNRQGFSVNFRYLDTLRIARSTLRTVPNYKQDTLATHYGLINPMAHRAESDALTCGRILLALLAEIES